MKNLKDKKQEDENKRWRGRKKGNRMRRRGRERK